MYKHTKEFFFLLYAYISIQKNFFFFSIFNYKNTHRKKNKEKFTRLHISLFLHVWFPHYSSFGCLVLKKEKGKKKRKVLDI